MEAVPDAPPTTSETAPAPDAVGSIMERIGRLMVRRRVQWSADAGQEPRDTGKTQCSNNAVYQSRRYVLFVSNVFLVSILHQAG